MADVQLNSNWPWSVTYYYDPDDALLDSIIMPRRPVDSEEVEVKNTTTSVTPQTIAAAAGHVIQNPSTLEYQATCQVDGPGGATRWKFRTETLRWEALNIENALASKTIETVSQAYQRYDARQSSRTIEVVQPGLIGFGYSADAIRQKVTIKNSCPNDFDGVDLVSMDARSRFRFAHGIEATRFRVERGQSVEIQAFATYWLIIDYSQPPPSIKQVNLPYEVTGADTLVEVIGGAGILQLPDPAFNAFVLDRHLTVKNSTDDDITIASHVDTVGYTIEMVDLGDSNWGVTTTQGTSTSFAFLDQTWTALQTIDADTLVLAMPAQPTYDGQVVPQVRITSDAFSSDVIATWSATNSRYEGTSTNVRADLEGSTYPEAFGVVPVGVPPAAGVNQTVKFRNSLYTNGFSLGTARTTELVLNAAEDEWLVTRSPDIGVRVLAESPTADLLDFGTAWTDIPGFGVTLNVGIPDSLIFQFNLGLKWYHNVSANNATIAWEWRALGNGVQIGDIQAESYFTARTGVFEGTVSRGFALPLTDGDVVTFQVRKVSPPTPAGTALDVLQAGTDLSLVGPLS